MGNRFVIIGCGQIAHRHVEQVNRIGKLVGACDPDANTLTQFTIKYLVPGFSEAAALLQQCQADVAIICSPNYLHITHIKIALERGLYVLCEKPLCINRSELSDLENILKIAGNKVFLVLSARFHKEIIRLRQQIMSGELGEILSFQMNACWNRTTDYFDQSAWKGTLQQDGGILYTQFSHYLDVLIWCLGEIKPIAVKRSNRLHQHSIEGEDTGVALLQTRRNGLGSFHWTVNSNGKNYEISLLVIGEKGTKKIGGQYMNELEYEHFPGKPAIREIKLEESQSGGQHELIYAQLALAIAGQPHNLPGIAEGLAAINLIEAIYDMPQDPIFRSSNA